MCECEVVVRYARNGDLPARAQLLKDSLRELHWDAFLLFFFQELTLQALVLCGAVLFIFCGVSVAGCMLLLPAAAAVVSIGVWFSHLAAAENLEQCMRNEETGFVAEFCGPLMLEPQLPVMPKIRLDLQSYDTSGEQNQPLHKQIIGTVSMEEARGAAGGWVRGLCVRRGARQRGVARALLAAARAHAQRHGLPALHCHATQLQPEARTLLHNQGWECCGQYGRQIFGAALTLLVAQFTLTLPHA